MALILTWLRLSTLRQLDWYRNSSYQSKDIAHVQKQIAQKMADKVGALRCRAVSSQQSIPSGVPQRVVCLPYCPGAELLRPVVPALRKALSGRPAERRWRWGCHSHGHPSHHAGAWHSRRPSAGEHASIGGRFVHVTPGRCAVHARANASNTVCPHFLCLQGIEDHFLEQWHQKLHQK